MQPSKVEIEAPNEEMAEAFKTIFMRLVQHEMLPPCSIAITIAKPVQEPEQSDEDKRAFSVVPGPGIKQGPPPTTTNEE